MQGLISLCRALCANAPKHLQAEWKSQISPPTCTSAREYKKKLPKFTNNPAAQKIWAQLFKVLLASRTC